MIAKNIPGASSVIEDALSKRVALGIEGFNYSDLHKPERLAHLYSAFTDYLKEQDKALHQHYADYCKTQGSAMRAQQVSHLLIDLAPILGSFLATLFGVEKERAVQMQAVADEMESIFLCQREVINKGVKRIRDASLCEQDRVQFADSMALLRKLGATIWHGTDDPELASARMGLWLKKVADHFALPHEAKTATYAETENELSQLRQRLNDNEEAKARFAEILSINAQDEFITALYEQFLKWCLLEREYALHNSNSHDSWVLFKSADRQNFDNLVPHREKEEQGFSTWSTKESTPDRRDGFSLTDSRFDLRAVLHEVEHCIYCHERDTDSCSKGMRNKKEGGFKSNPLGSALIGCPLEEKISEMHLMKRMGDNIAALALVVIDNPMCPGTGHRICNDCMKGCIYQKSEPVNIPQIETNVLTEVLFMPYGFEIYSLLTRWNPLNVKRPYALPYNGKKVLVVGMGPAGYTLAHYLLNEGFGVVGIDALKIEPLPATLRQTEQAICDFRPLYEDMANRLQLGFGGVAEYGITARWDKNFLKVIYLNLLRRSSFLCLGGVRFGGTLTVDDAWDLGFHHIAMATGAGKPTIIGLKNNLIRGIRKASDFLMALQLTGAAKKESMANLQVRLPAGIIGGGLTAIDTCTEMIAYYPLQVEKILTRYRELCQRFGEATVHAMYDEEEKIILDEFLGHGEVILKERERAAAQGEKPCFAPLVKNWGGVTLFYRKGIKDSPAYRQNHEEIIEALKEGVRLADGMSPVGAKMDEYGALRAVCFDSYTEKMGKWVKSGAQCTVPLKSLFIAAGTSPNTIYEQEHPYSFRMQGKYFQRYAALPQSNNGSIELIAMDDVATPKLAKSAPFTSYQHNNRYISFYGDNHPVYAGNVVKAMASAKEGYPEIVKLFSREELSVANSEEQIIKDAEFGAFRENLEDLLTARVVAVNRLTPTIVEVIVKAPMQARKFEPGQFYRVQNLEALAPRVGNTRLTAEALALTGAAVDKTTGHISLITLEMGGSSRLCATWQVGDPLIVMGVTGTPTEIPKNKTVMLIGGGLGNAVLFSIGKALRAQNNRVVYFAGYRKPGDQFMAKEIEAAADVVIWSIDDAPGVRPIQTNRAQDKSNIGNILESVERYANGSLGAQLIRLDDVDHMIVIGSDRMMNAVKEARHQRWSSFLKSSHIAIGSINSPMQCMMKGVCAQCLCKHVDPHTREESFVYSCYNQDQLLDEVDFPNLAARLRQNSVQEKLSNLWLDLMLEHQKEQDLSRKNQHREQSRHGVDSI